MSRRKLMWIVCIGIPVVLAGPGYFWLRYYAFGSPITPPHITAEHRRLAEREMGLRFPESAQLMVYSPWIQQLEVKLVIPGADLPQLLGQKRLKGAKWESDDASQFDGEKNVPELNIRHVRKFRFTHVEPAEFTNLDVLIDDTSDSVKTVYLSWYLT